MELNLTILTGAGISAESGIPTFRDAETGLWENYKIDEVATPEAFEANPDLVHRFYNERRAQLSMVEPNAAHYALADLQKFWMDKLGTFFLITQNIDNLHERSGSTNVYHMHGELMKLRCTICKEAREFSDESSVKSVCPVCGNEGHMRPHVVWFGEMPLYMDFIEAKLLKTDHYIAVGTSGTVMPASLFADWVARNGRYSDLNEIVEITKESSDNNAFTINIEGNATESVPAYVESLKSKISELLTN